MVAIYLLEESLLNVTGRSVLHFNRGLSINKSNLDMYGLDAATQMQQFEAHVLRFLASHNCVVSRDEDSMEE